MYGGLGFLQNELFSATLKFELKIGFTCTMMLYKHSLYNSVLQSLPIQMHYVFAIVDGRMNGLMCECGHIPSMGGP